MRDTNRVLNTKHGRYYTGTYSSWKSMKFRCLNKTSKPYPKYGGRGIKVCKRWMDFDAFYEDMGDRPIGTSLDRIDNDKGYEPGNCRWATPTEQSVNQRRIVNYTVAGITGCLYVLARAFGFNPSTVRERVQRGWGLKRALTEAVNHP